MPLQVARLVASSFALVAFALAIAIGLSAGNPTDAIIGRALVTLIVAAIGGYSVGLAFEHLVRVAAQRLDESAEQILAEEEAALQAALHPLDAGGHPEGMAHRGGSAPQPVVAKPAK